ncbi:helix-turn-helix domain-containing protein [Azospirillum sp. B21]|uniref:helix-turn-helix domain-containing protein n=1 Tax=Azospirillum sp. B21 TaxID=2607496 RepID=UPI0011F09806|nr:helix-turn-helix domain-containing protein [Azospirillum sp. B21]KAA0572241.1 helix-turn-helix domain-containing protein [Azospirillum sp. B21]
MHARIFLLRRDAYVHIIVHMNPMHHIRTSVLKISQKAMAEITGRDQATVSRWERGELEPSRDDMERVRNFARSLKRRWDDKLFFEAPPEVDGIAPPRRRPRRAPAEARAS